MQHAPREPEAGRRLDRRGVIAGAAALAGVALAKLTGAETAQGSHNTNIAYDSQTVVHGDVTNTTSGSTRISSNISGSAAFVGLNDYPVGISRPDGILGRTTYSTSNAAGVAGSSDAPAGGIGVLGTSDATDGVGVYGFAGSSVPSEDPPEGTGVFGRGPNQGLVGRSSNGSGVLGESETDAAVRGHAAGGTGVFGFSGASGDAEQVAGGTGVYGKGSIQGVLGRAAAGGGVGVLGESTDSHGVRGVATGAAAAVRGDGGAAGRGVEGRGGSVGVAGESGEVGVSGVSSGGGTGVQGKSSSGTAVRGETETGVGLLGVASGTGVAARFAGRTVVEGALEVVGAPPSVLVAASDGTRRRAYQVSSLDPVFEYVGEARLRRGRATVKLPAGFDVLAPGRGYHVALTEYGNAGGLYVASRREHEFVVRARNRRAKSSFGYRLVVKRKDLSV